jgi:predicted nuclease of predicted toxin-antitoxin system
MRRVLLDEQLPRDLVRALKGVQADTVHDRHWDGLQNGELLRLASAEYDVFVTMDRNLPYQQNLGGLPLGIVLVRAPSNRLQHLRPLAAAIVAAINAARPGAVEEAGQ